MTEEHQDGAEEMVSPTGVDETVVPGEVLEEKGPGALNRRQIMRRGTLATLLGGVFWGISGTCSKFLMERYGIDPLWLVCIRQLGAGVLLLLLATVHRRGSVPSVVKDGPVLRTALICALLGLGFNSIGYLEAVEITDSGTATVLQTVSIALMLLVICAQTHRTPRGKEWLGLVLALGGTYLVATHGDLGALHIPPDGLFWGLACAVGATIMGVVNRPILAAKGAIPIIGLEMCVVGTVLAVVVRPWESIPVFDAGGWALLAFTIVVGTVMAYGLYFQGVKDVGAYRAGLLGTIEPVTATVATVVAMGTPFTGAELIGFVMILATVVFTG